MNIIDCIKSGKPFKRPKWDGFIGPFKGFATIDMALTPDDITENDWIIRSEPKKLGRLYIHKEGYCRAFRCEDDVDQYHWTPVRITENGEVWEVGE